MSIKLLTSQEAADYLGLPIGRFRKHVRTGNIKPLDDVKRCQRFRKEDLDRFANQTVD